MAKSKSNVLSQNSSEFPILKSLGLTIVGINGDGNCLFSALSHQLYGHIENQQAIRSRIVCYMRENPDNFKGFISYDGGEYRNPNRKARRQRASKFDTPSQEEAKAKIEEAWEKYLQALAMDSTWGDNLALQAFTLVYKHKVRVYQKNGECDIVADEKRHGFPMLQLAFHDWCHYSSVCSIQLHASTPAIESLVPSIEGFATPTAKKSVKLRMEQSPSQVVGGDSGTIKPTSSITKDFSNAKVEKPTSRIGHKNSEGKTGSKPTAQASDKIIRIERTVTKNTAFSAMFGSQATKKIKNSSKDKIEKTQKSILRNSDTRTIQKSSLAQDSSITKVENWNDGSVIQPQNLDWQGLSQQKAGNLTLQVFEKAGSSDASRSSASLSIFSSSPQYVSSPLSRSSVGVECDGGDNTFLEAPVRRRRLVARKDLPKPFARDISPSSLSKKRFFTVEKYSYIKETTTRNVKRLRQEISSKNTSSRSLNM